MASLPNPVIVVPGITATYLRDEYTLPPNFPWTVVTKKFDQVALHPDDLRYERIEPARTQPDQIYEIAYRELIEELRHNLSPKADQPVPVYPFGYDWRQPLVSIEAQLEAFIDEVINRTKLLRHYDADGYAEDSRVNLVGHSMGGLVIAGTVERMARNGTAKQKLGKVASLAAPFRGSFEAVIKIATGTANMGGDVPSSREREAARLTPALYHLFPSMKDAAALQIEQGLPQTSLFDPALVQPSVIETIVEFIRLNGLNKKDRNQQAHDLLTLMLDTARKHRERIEKLKLTDAGMTSNDWLCVVGVGSVTRVKMVVKNDKGKPLYDLSSAYRLNEWKSAAPADGNAAAAVQNRYLTGDGTVPFAGAIPGFLALENLVCVTPDDYGYWELQDRAVSSQAGFHGILPNMDMLHRMLAAHFKGPKADRNRKKYDNIWGRPAPGVTEQNWDPAIAGLMLKDG
jgi:pimeloyl-ACP methyl ester carboxylesterase